MNTAILSVAQIVISNPIIYDEAETKKEYYNRLNSYIRAGQWNRRKYEKSELSAYQKILVSSEMVKGVHDISYYRYYILLDVIHILGYEVKLTDNDKFESLKEKYFSDFGSKDAERQFVNKLLAAFTGNGEEKYRKVKAIAKSKALGDAGQYIRLVLKNLMFMEKKPSGIMITATMSAGKSTFINALTGKYVCLSQNMACTSKIHHIVNKAFEDGYSYEYDHDLIMTAGREELLNDNTENNSDKIVVGTHFVGPLGAQRIIISDSPGVNYSGDKEHEIITDKLMKGRNYHLLIYIMNATQLGTNDEDVHLEYVKKTIGRTPVLFIMNKIDAFNVEEEDFEAAIQRQTDYLKKKGFKNPIVCPVSARAGYLGKRYEMGNLSRAEQREFYNYIDKFAQMNLPVYYGKMFRKIKIANADSEELQLQKMCGLAYVEKIIIKLMTGGQQSGTGLC